VQLRRLERFAWLDPDGGDSLSAEGDQVSSDCARSGHVVDHDVVEACVDDALTEQHDRRLRLSVTINPAGKKGGCQARNDRDPGKRRKPGDAAGQRADLGGRKYVPRGSWSRSC